MDKKEMTELEAQAARTTEARKQIEAKNTVLRTIAENLNVIAAKEAENKKFEETIAKRKAAVEAQK